MRASDAQLAPHRTECENPPSSKNGIHQLATRIRQDRIKSTEKILFLEIAGRTFEVVDYSAYGIAVRSAQPLPFTGESISARLLLGNVEVESFEARQIRNEEREAGPVTAFEILGRSLNIEKILAMKMACRVISFQEQKAHRYAVVPLEFRGKVYEVERFLSELEIEVNSLSALAPKNVYQDLVEFEQAVCITMAGFLSQYLSPVYDDLVSCLAKTVPEFRPLVLNFFRERMEGFLYQAPFAHRSFTKPLGYAGDFEVMNLIYRDQPEGETLFAKCLHRYFIDQPAAKAVRNRIGYLQAHFGNLKTSAVSDLPLRLLSVASGPALELQLALSHRTFGVGRKIEIYLLDQDIESLKHAQRRLVDIVRVTGQNCEIKYLHRTIRNVVGHGLEMKGFDLVYSLGLFDYLSDSICQSLAKRLLDVVLPGGRLIIGNFDINNPTRNTMELALDWNLIYRSESDMRRLFGALGCEFSIEREKEKINLFGVLTKNGRVGTQSRPS